MNQETSKYLKLLHYPLKLEEVLKYINYSTFCSNNSGLEQINQHKSFLLYLVCNGYQFEKIISDEIPDLKKTARVINICKYGDYCIVNINQEKFESIGKLYNTTHFTEFSGRKFFKIDDKCMNHIYYEVEKTLYNISKELLYKHFILYNSNFIEFDIISYIINISLKLLTR